MRKPCTHERTCRADHPCNTGGDQQGSGEKHVLNATTSSSGSTPLSDGAKRFPCGLLCSINGTVVFSTTFTDIAEASIVTAFRRFSLEIKYCPRLLYIRLSFSIYFLYTLIYRVHYLFCVPSRQRRPGSTCGSPSAPMADKTSKRARGAIWLCLFFYQRWTARQVATSRAVRRRKVIAF